MNFNEREYEELLAEIQNAQYNFRTLVEEPGEQTMYIRHDVDHSPIMARRLAVIEAEKDVVSSFFFLLGADGYRLLSNDILSLMGEISDMGHLVGLHLDERRIGSNERGLKETIAWFRRNIHPVPDVFSFHRPTEETIGKDYNELISAYGPDRFAVAHYASDSRRNPDFQYKLEKMIEEERSPIQLLLHPAWWCGEDSLASIGWMIAARRETEVRDHLLDDWGAVFKGVLPPGEEDLIV